MLQKINIAIDGYSGTGKSSSAQLLAHQLQYTYINTGLIYRACAYHLLNHHIDINDLDAVQTALASFHITIDDQHHLTLDNQIINDQLKTFTIDQQVPIVAAIAIVRTHITALIQQMISDKGYILCGRDIGSVIIPDAAVKFFLTSDLLVRVDRALKRDHQQIEYELKKNFLARDYLDQHRLESPLSMQQHTIMIDTSRRNLSEVVKVMLKHVFEYFVSHETIRD